VALPFYIKKYLKAKEELWKLKYFTMQKYNLQKNPLKETKILQDLLLPRGQKGLGFRAKIPLSYYTL
jgi:hypothetical protein